MSEKKLKNNGKCQRKFDDLPEIVIRRLIFFGIIFNAEQTKHKIVWRFIYHSQFLFSLSSPVVIVSVSWHWTWWFAVCLVYNRDNSSKSLSLSFITCSTDFTNLFFFRQRRLKQQPSDVDEKKCTTIRVFFYIFCCVLCVWTVAKNNNKLQLKQVLFLDVTKVLTNNSTFFLSCNKKKI